MERNEGVLCIQHPVPIFPAMFSSGRVPVVSVNNNQVQVASTSPSHNHINTSCQAYAPSQPECESPQTSCAESWCSEEELDDLCGCPQDPRSIDSSLLAEFPGGDSMIPGLSLNDPEGCTLDDDIALFLSEEDLYR